MYCLQNAGRTGRISTEPDSATDAAALSQIEIPVRRERHREGIERERESEGKREREEGTAEHTGSG